MGRTRWMRETSSFFPRLTPAKLFLLFRELCAFDEREAKVDKRCETARSGRGRGKRAKRSSIELSASRRISLRRDEWRERREAAAIFTIRVCTVKKNVCHRAPTIRTTSYTACCNARVSKSFLSSGKRRERDADLRDTCGPRAHRRGAPFERHALYVCIYICGGLSSKGILN